MEAYLSKILPLFIYPVGLTISLAILGWLFAVFGRRRLGLFSLVCGIGVLWVSATPLVANYFYGLLESRFPPVAISAAPEKDAIIVLGGALGKILPPRVTSDLTGASDRILAAARLYRAGKAGKVLVAAGNQPWMAEAKPEAELIKDLLMEWGVQDKDIILDASSINTYQNAKHAKTLMDANGLKNGLLVTSASHMPRAIAVFGKAGLDVSPFPVDYQVVRKESSNVFDWLPDAGALGMTTQAIREWLGMLVYRYRYGVRSCCLTPVICR